MPTPETDAPVVLIASQGPTFSKDIMVESPFKTQYPNTTPPEFQVTNDTPGALAQIAELKDRIVAVIGSIEGSIYFELIGEYQEIIEAARKHNPELAVTIFNLGGNDDFRARIHKALGDNVNIYQANPEDVRVALTETADSIAKAMGVEPIETAQQPEA